MKYCFILPLYEISLKNLNKLLKDNITVYRYEFHISVPTTPTSVIVKPHAAGPVWGEKISWITLRSLSWYFFNNIRVVTKLAHANPKAGIGSFSKAEIAEVT